MPGTGVGLVALLTGALLVRALVRSWGGLDPRSAYLDDQWVVLAVREARLGELLGLHLPMPVGFTAVSELVTGFVSDPVVALQLLPLICWLASIALAPVVAFRLSRSAWVAALAAVLVASAPIAEAHAVRTKHYTLDLLVTLLLLLPAARLLERPEPRRLAAFAVAGLVALAFSFTSIFLTVSAVVVALVVALRAVEPSEDQKKRMVLLTAGFFAVVVTAHLLYLRHASRLVMQAFWSDYFLWLESWSDVRTFVTGPLAQFFTDPFAGVAAVLVVLAPLGLVELWRSGRRSYAGALALFYASLLVASALWIYPLGAGRTDVFAHAVTIMLACLGAAFVVKRVRLRALARGAYVAILALALVPLVRARPVTYPPNQDRDAVDWVLARLGVDDALVLSPYGALAFSWFGPHPVEIVPVDFYGHGFDAVPERARTFRSFLGRWDLTDDAGVAAELDRLRGFLADAPDKLVYLETTGTPRGRALVTGAVAAAGYRLVESQPFGPTAAALVFEAGGEARAPEG